MYQAETPFLIELRMIRVRLLLSIQMICFCYGVEQVSPPWGFVFDDWAGDPLDVIV